MNNSGDAGRLNGSYFLPCRLERRNGPRRIRTVDLRGIFNWQNVVLTFFHSSALQKRSKSLPGPASEFAGFYEAVFGWFRLSKTR